MERFAFEILPLNTPFIETHRHNRPQSLGCQGYVSYCAYVLKKCPLRLPSRTYAIYVHQQI